MLKCMIIDDELPCVETLTLMLRKKFSDVAEVVGTITDPTKAAALITEIKPDVLFLDVEMPHLSGIAFLQTLEHINFQVIFTTAHQHYALQAIKWDALDYLMKPISLAELSVAIKKCINRQKEQGHDLVTSFLEQIKFNNTTTRKIPIPSNNNIQFVPVNEIIRIESSSNYSTVFFISRPKVLVAKTLKEFEEQLLPFNFLRVHHSHLINIEHVIGYKNEDGGYVIMQGNDVIEISRRKKQEVLQRLHSI